MIFFILLLSSSFLLIYCRKRVVWIYWVLIALVSAFRFEVGSDFLSYTALYYDIQSGYQSYLHLEPFHIYITKFANYYDLGPQFIFFIYSLTTIFLFALFFYKASEEYRELSHRVIFSLSTIIFIGNYYFLTLNSIRSCLAAALYVLSLYLFYKNKKIWMLLFLIVGGMIHYSLIPVALMSLLLLQFIFPVKNKTFYIFIAIIITNPLSIIKYIFVNYKLMYYNYFLSDTYAVPANFIGQISAYGGVVLAIIFYYFFMKNIGIQNKKLKAVLQLSILLFVAFRIFSSDLFIFARMSRYFSPILYFFTAVAIAHVLRNKVPQRMFYPGYLLVILILIVSNILMFIPRGLSDPSYGSYKINYCITSSDVCDITISTLK